MTKRAALALVLLLLAALPGATAAAREPRLPLEQGSLSLPAGRSVVRVDLPAGQMVSLAVLGKQSALLGFDVTGSSLAARVRAHGSLDEDGLLPRVASLLVPAGESSLLVVVDAVEPVLLARSFADPGGTAAPSTRDLKSGAAVPRALVGMPAPGGYDDGYMLQSPARYQFVRVDVAVALMAAFRQSRVRFKRDPIAIADCSQWDGVRPATDIGRPRHISHEGGRDVDIALPAADESASTVRAHCSGVLVEQDVQGCAPGTARGVDALRLAYLLGLLIEGYGMPEPPPTSAKPGVKLPPVSRLERIFTDDVYVREIKRAADKLRERRWIKDWVYETLIDDNLLRPSAWHTDHLHLRFVGEPGRAWFAPSEPP